MISTGTGRIVSIGQSPPSHNNTTSDTLDKKRTGSVMYTNPALSIEADEDEEVAILAELLSSRQNALFNEFKSVLIVDSHDIFLRLLTKGVKLMLPHVEIVTANDVNQASREIENSNRLRNKRNNPEQYSHGFDLILIEERLDSTKRQPSSHGSSLIEKIKREINVSFYNKNKKRHPLIIGISAYLELDRQRLQSSGSDLVWGKPPPKMDDEMRMCLLQKIMTKRNRPDVVDLFH